MSHRKAHMMRIRALVLAASSFGLAWPAAAQAQPKPQPYEGQWAPDRAACRDEDGVNRMEITGSRFFWYETRCRARDVKADGRSNGRSWTMRLSCEGEG